MWMCRCFCNLVRFLVFEFGMMVMFSDVWLWFIRLWCISVKLFLWFCSMLVIVFSVM